MVISTFGLGDAILFVAIISVAATADPVKVCQRRSEDKDSAWDECPVLGELRGSRRTKPISPEGRTRRRRYTKSLTRRRTRRRTKSLTKSLTKSPTLPGAFEGCLSEGGKDLTCARCDYEGGRVPCRQNDRENAKGCKDHFQDQCPDDLTKGKFYLYRDHGHGCCYPFWAGEALTRAAVTLKGVQVKHNLSATVATVGTKAATFHPEKAGLDIGAIAFKRVLMHTKNGTQVADVHKVGVCIKCPLISISKFSYTEHQQIYGLPGSQQYRMAKENGVISADGKKRKVFHSIYPAHNTQNELKVFASQCVDKAFADGKLKQDYECGTDSRTAKIRPDGRYINDPGYQATADKKSHLYWKPLFSDMEAFENDLALL